MSVAGVVAQVGVDLLVVLHEPLPQADGGGVEDRTPDVVEAALIPSQRTLWDDQEPVRGHSRAYFYPLMIILILDAGPFSCSPSWYSRLGQTSSPARLGSDGDFLEGGK